MSSDPDTERVLEICREVGCPDVEDIDSCIDCLESRASDPHDGQREAACVALRKLRKHLGTSARFRVGGFLNRHCPDKPAPGIEDPLPELRDILQPEDPEWIALLERLGENASADRIYAYADRLVRVFTPRAEDGEVGARQGFLTRHRALFQGVLQALGRGLSRIQQIKLKQWIAEGTALELETEYAAVEEQPERWPQVAEQLERQVETLTSLAQSDAQNALAEQVRAALGDYRRWRHDFELYLEQFELHEFDDTNYTEGEACWPWSESGGKREPWLTHDHLHDVFAPDRWRGSAADRDRTDRVLTELSQKGLAGLQSPLQPEEAPARLARIEAMRSDWPEALGELPLSDQWSAAREGLERSIAAEAVAALEPLREAFESPERSRNALQGHAKLALLDKYASQDLRDFSDQLRTLDRIGRLRRDWWELGPTEVLEDGRYADASRELDALQGQWGRSPGFEDLRRGLTQVREELECLAQAKGSLEDGDQERTLAILDQCRSPAAERLRTHAGQFRVDAAIRRHMETGTLEKVSDRELASASEPVRRELEQTRKGHQFVAELTARVETMLLHQGRGPDLPRMLELAVMEVPQDTALSPPDASALSHLRDQVRQRSLVIAEAAVSRLHEDIRCFPPLQDTEIQALDGRLQELTRALDHEGFSPLAANRIRDDLQPIAAVLDVQRKIAERAWDQALERLQSPEQQARTEHRQRRELLASVKTARLIAEKGDQDQWLELFHELPEVLLRQTEYREHYLKALRRSVKPGMDPSRDLGILERYFPEETYLTGLLWCFDTPTRVRDLQGEPGRDDEQVVATLLQDWSGKAEHYHLLQRLWRMLPEAVRGRVWSPREDAQTPLVRLERNAARELDALDRGLADPSQDLAGLKERADRIVRAGLADEQTRRRFDSAMRLDRRMAELARQDPWSDRLLPLLERTGRDIDNFELEVRQARGWLEAVAKRRRGIDAWQVLEAAWSRFRNRFDGKYTGFYLDADQWRDPKEWLAEWIQAIDRALPRLDWSLPMADNSGRWKQLIRAWGETQEGSLWRDDRRPAPENLDALLAAYRTVEQQLVSFAELHRATLAWSKRGAGRRDDDDGDRLRERIEAVKPLCGPVRAIRMQLLTNVFAP